MEKNNVIPDELIVNKILEKLKGHNPQIAIFAGSGFKDIIDLENKTIISYRECGFKYAELEGHNRNFIFGNYKGVEVVIVSRFHYYETGTSDILLLLYYILYRLGVKTVISTTAVGGVNLAYKKGDLMLIKSHINFTGHNPLIGKQPIEFIDMTDAYDKKLRELVKATAKQLKIKLYEGVHLQTNGPSYETPAEVIFFRVIGADTVSMSTAYGNICARKFGMKYIGFAGITNKAVDENSEQLSHEIVVKACEQISGKVKKIIQKIIPNL